ncbi:hypothetical protein GmHk_03G008796 [Glycine max]|nr:hypothetical protein GmHk_03G008796 [Glycine max]
MHLHLSNPNQSLDPLSPEIEGIRYRDPIVSPSWDWAPLVASSSLHCGPFGRAYGLHRGRRQALWRNSPSKLRLRFDLKIWVSSSLSIYHICMCNMLILLSILHIIVNGPTLCFGNNFSIQLKRNKSDVVLNNNRRLLNTEKLIFKTNSNQDEFQSVLVTVEPEGFPAKLHVAERQFIIFNIVSDELLLGIPHKAWWVVALALLGLGIAFIVPSFLPLYLLPKKQVSRTDNYVSKTS